MRAIVIEMGNKISKMSEGNNKKKHKRKNVLMFNFHNLHLSPQSNVKELITINSFVRAKTFNILRVLNNISLLQLSPTTMGKNLIHL